MAANYSAVGFGGVSLGSDDMRHYCAPQSLSAKVSVPHASLKGSIGLSTCDDRPVLELLSVLDHT